MAKEGICEARGMEFEGLKTYHDTSQGSERGINMMYLFEMEGLRICHCGDLGCIPDDSVLSKIKGADILMVPTGEVFTMVLPEVRRFIEIVNPNIIIPMHYRVGGLTLPITPLDDFLEMMPEDYVDYVGNEIDVASDDLTEMKECWVFDR
jgi:L-ascorbate metabolism protein UlaG (beta-lactamase superfamily)